MAASRFPRPKVSWAQHPAPMVPSRAEVEALIRRAFPELELAAELLSLIRPCIHLWPGVAIEPTPNSLRLGGLPFAPEDWIWPLVDGEPMQLVAEFDCAALSKFAAAAELPPDGTLAFFGGPDLSYDTIFTAGPERAAVFHWPAGTPLHLAEAPPGLVILPLSGVQPIEVYELPGTNDPRRPKFMGTNTTRASEQVDKYYKLQELMEGRSSDQRYAPRRTPTKLLGWPGFLRYHPEAPPTPPRLLLRVGEYDNGEVERTWIGTGSSTFTIEEAALSEFRFDLISMSSNISLPLDRRSTFPLPPAWPRKSIEQAIANNYPDEIGGPLAAQIRPGVLLWPRSGPADPTVSRLGGKPLAPPDWEWPVYNEEPMLFVAQINCADLKDEAAELLPRDGMLSFFADPDMVNGADFGGSDECCAVFHWPASTELVPHDPPEEDIEILLPAGVEFLETYTLPHTLPDVPAGRGANWDFRVDYLHTHGIVAQPRGRQPDMSYSTQLLGWHSPVQGQLYSCEGPEWRLLLQVGVYDNGEKAQWWGSGGAIYFMISEEDLLARRFDRVFFEAQFT